MAKEVKRSELVFLQAKKDDRCIDMLLTMSEIQKAITRAEDPKNSNLIPLIVVLAGLSKNHLSVSFGIVSFLIVQATRSKYYGSEDCSFNEWLRNYRKRRRNKDYGNSQGSFSSYSFTRRKVAFGKVVALR